MTDTLPLLVTPLLVTHSGKFHCDEVFAYAVLRLALGLGAPGTDHRLVRTRDAKVIASGDIVWDVGTQYDVAAKRFDHHQRGAPTRPDGTPYSSAGLIWKEYGTAAVTALLAPDARVFAATVAAELDESLVRYVDENDNGVAASRESYGLASLVGDFNPPWDADGGDAAADAAFLGAVEMVTSVLDRRVNVVRGKQAADAVVMAAHAASADPRVLELDRGMPWKSAVFSHALPVIYAVYPASNGNWMVDTMPPEPGSFDQRLPLPEAWAGLQDQALADASGVADAVFTHVRRFVGAARTRAGAVAMARKALEAGAGA